MASHPFSQTSKQPKIFIDFGPASLPALPVILAQFSSFEQCLTIFTFHIPLNSHPHHCSSCPFLFPASLSQPLVPLSPRHMNTLLKQTFSTSTLHPFLFSASSTRRGGAHYSLQHWHVREPQAKRQLNISYTTFPHPSSFESLSVFWTFFLRVRNTSWLRNFSLPVSSTIRFQGPAHSGPRSYGFKLLIFNSNSSRIDLLLSYFTIL